MAEAFVSPLQQALQANQVLAVVFSHGHGHELAGFYLWDAALALFRPMVTSGLEIDFNGRYGLGREGKKAGGNMAQSMLKTGMKTGLIAAVVGIGLGHAINRQDRPASLMASPEAIAACHKRTLESAVNIQDIRSLGREESRIIGLKLARTREPAGTAFQESNYQLRTLGRAEARQTGRSMERDGEDMDILAGVGGDIYNLRSLGRGEAHDTGTDFCELAGPEDTQYGLR